MSKDLSMDIDWRLVQIFIGFDGISEVSIASHDNRKITCSCAVFMTSARCKHSKFVKAKMAESDGNYIVQIPEDIPDEDAVDAMMDAESWRDFVRKYAKVETID